MTVSRHCNTLQSDPLRDPKSSLVLNYLCSGRTKLIVTNCVLINGQWCVDKRGIWPVFGSPYELHADSRKLDQSEPLLVYPNIEFATADIVGEITLREGCLLCVELVLEKKLTSDTNKLVLPRYTSFIPADVCDDSQYSLFKGSIGFDALADVWISKQRISDPQSCTITLNGPTGGRARMQIMSNRRRSIVTYIDLLTRHRPSSIVCQLIHISILFDDHLPILDRFISAEKG